MPRVLHISDIHFGPPHVPAAAESLLELARSRRPELVVVSGDLTQRAKPRQFREARAFVDRIEALGLPTLTVPGNHDVPLYRVWERLLSPLGAYKKNFSSELEPGFERDGLFVVGINSAHGLTFTEGRVRLARLREVEAKLASAPRGATKIVVVHHLLVAPPRFGKQQVLRNAAAVVRVFARAGVDLVLSGHYHQGFFAASNEYFPDHPPFFVLAAGTGSSNRGRAAERGVCSCFSIDVRPAGFVVEHLRWTPSANGFEPGPRHELPRPAKG